MSWFDDSSDTFIDHLMNYTIARLSANKYDRSNTKPILIGIISSRPSAG